MNDQTGSECVAACSAGISSPCLDYCLYESQQTNETDEHNSEYRIYEAHNLLARHLSKTTNTDEPNNYAQRFGKHRSPFYFLQQSIASTSWFYQPYSRSVPFQCSSSSTSLIAC
jgi:hypothetical protein